MKEKVKIKIKYEDINKQKLATWMAYALILAVSILSSLLVITFDTEHFDKSRFVMNLCINMMIAIFGLMLSLQDGKNTFEWQKKGFLWEAKELFNQARKLVVDTNIFRQYADMLFIREKNAFVDAQLTAYGIYTNNYLNASESDLKVLCKQPKKCVIGFNEDGTEKIKPLDQITELQYHVIKKYKAGKFEFKKIEYSAFLYAEKGNSYKRMADSADNERKMQVMSIFYRLSILVIFSIIFALAMVDTREANGKQILFDTISRVFNLFASVFMGYTLAWDSAKRKEEILIYKADIINQFVVEKETGVFVPVDYEEEILMRIDEIEKKKAKEEEEKNKNVVIPEVVDEPVKEEEETDFEITEEEIKLLLENRAKSDNK